jgi:opacity protein-like surface antigen
MKRLLILALLFVLAAGSVMAKDPPKPKPAKATASTTATAKKTKPKTTTKGTRCEAMTAKGTQCTRAAQAGSKFCWQHQPGGAVKKPAPKKG